MQKQQSENLLKVLQSLAAIEQRATILKQQLDYNSRQASENYVYFKQIANHSTKDIRVIDSAALQTHLLKNGSNVNLKDVILLAPSTIKNFVSLQSLLIELLETEIESERLLYNLKLSLEPEQAYEQLDSLKVGFVDYDCLYRFFTMQQGAATLEPEQIICVMQRIKRGSHGLSKIEKSEFINFLKCEVHTATEQSYSEKLIDKSFLQTKNQKTPTKDSSRELRTPSKSEYSLRKKSLLLNEDLKLCLQKLKTLGQIELEDDLLRQKISQQIKCSHKTLFLNFFDIQGKGYLTLETFEEALNKLLPLYDPSAAKSLFFRLDKKKTGRVDAKIFTKILGDDNYSQEKEIDQIQIAELKQSLSLLMQGIIENEGLAQCVQAKIRATKEVTCDELFEALDDDLDRLVDLNDIEKCFESFNIATTRDIVDCLLARVGSDGKQISYFDLARGIYLQY